MPETDPYATLGVPRSASREEIARAYRALAKRHHPDAGAAPSARMARINEAWRVLSDPGRRAGWDRAHPIVAPPSWAPSTTAAAPAMRRPIQPDAPQSRLDSGWLAVLVVLAVALLVGGAMIGLSLATPPAVELSEFANDELRFDYPSDWTVAEGDPADPPEHRTIAHLVTFPVAGDELCTSYSSPCGLGVDEVPSGEASVFFTAWQGGTPPVPEPVTSRPFGLDADAIIGGQPAAFEIRRSDGDGITAWWQLSPPGFPDRWIEVLAVIGGGERERNEMLARIVAVLDTLEFE